MQVTITKRLSKSGDNIILIIPKVIVKEFGLEKGQLVEVTIKEAK